MAKTELQRETEAHYEAWLASRRRAVKGERGERLELIFAQAERLVHLRFEYMAGLKQAEDLRREVLLSIEDMLRALD